MACQLAVPLDNPDKFKCRVKLFLLNIAYFFFVVMPNMLYEYIFRRADVQVDNQEIDKRKKHVIEPIDYNKDLVPYLL
jgi:hypothetical protein